MNSEKNKNSYLDEQKEYRHILKYMGMLGSVQGLTIFLSIIRNKCAAIIIGALGIGTLDLYNRIIDFFSNVCNLGIPFCAIRRISQFYENHDYPALEKEVHVVREWGRVTGAIAFLIMLLAAPLFSFFIFNNFSKTTQFLLLAPIIAMNIIIGEELAILKGIRKLKEIATISTFTAIITTIGTILCYIFFGIRGILPALFISIGAQLALIINQTKKDFAFNDLKITRKTLYAGLPIITLGISYVITGLAGTGSEMLIRIFMIKNTSMTEVGFYAAGFTLCITYAKIIFVAMDSDYFPRLSGIVTNINKMRKTINNQIDVCVLLIAPFLILFIVFIHTIVLVLYSSEFISIVPMVICGSFYMFFKAITAPMSYLPLAKGDSKTFLVLELIYDFIFVSFIIVGFLYEGLMGAGLALSLSNMVETFLIYVVYRKRYSFQIQTKTFLNIVIQGLIVFIAIVPAMFLNGNIKYIIGLIVFIISCLWSWKRLKIKKISISALLKRSPR